MKKGILLAILTFLLFCNIVYATTQLYRTVLGQLQGNDFEVSILDAGDVGGYQIDITYNPDVVKFKEISYGNFLTQGNVETFKVQPNTETPGLIKAVAEARIGKVAGAEGGGVLFTAKFDRIAEGSGDVQISYVKIVDTEGKSIETAVKQNENPETELQTAPSISTEIILIVAVAIVVLAWAMFMWKNNK